MKKPMEAMTVNPYGEDYMAGAFIACSCSLITVDVIRDLFKEDTGIDIEQVIYSSGIARMIDEATGFQESALAKWLDWVAINHWGLKE